MSRKPDVDVLVLGGGCAGLSVAARLAGYSGTDLSVRILEPREQYENDRTWCFWGTAGHRFSGQVRHRWKAWLFSTAQSSWTQVSKSGISYQSIAADDFYASTVQSIEQSDRIELSLGTEANAIDPGADRVNVETNRGQLTARWVIDTRPARGQDDAPGFAQVFSGAEIETEAERFDPETAGLMSHMSCDSNGFRFTYILPFSKRRALVEETRFTAAADRSRLESGLEHSLEQMSDGSAYRVLRREAGRIPMSTRPAPQPASDRVFAAGLGGGAARPATGYAFSRIQRWAEDCAQRIRAGRPPAGHPPDPAWRSFADGLFLRVIEEQPEMAPDLFLALGRRVPPATLVRFLSDEGRLRDFARVAMALPKRPFLARLGTAAAA